VAYGSYDSPLLSDALIHHRDGVAGPWQDLTPPTQHPFEGDAGSTENLARWSPDVRGRVIDFELFSKIGFSVDAATATPRRASLWHLAVTGGSGTAAPTATYAPLARFIRPTEAIFAAQVKRLNNYADLRGDRLSEVISELPGPDAFLASVAYLHPARARWTLELLSAVFRLANFVEMRVKHALSCRRPLEYSPQLQPIIMSPAHGALPSGHATESFMAALVLWELLRPSLATGSVNLYALQLMRTAARVAINRQVAGVHTPVESAAGAMLGLTLGRYFVGRCAAVPLTYAAWEFNGENFAMTGDFLWTELFEIPSSTTTLPSQQATAYATAVTMSSGSLGDQSALLAWLWGKAAAEWV
jgi:membrane-associated phospholipid phosphatase